MNAEQNRNFAAATNGYTSLHTDDSAGFSWQPCELCKSPLGGERWETYGLKPAERGGMESEFIGDCCADCFEEIEY